MLVLHSLHMMQMGKFSIPTSLLNRTYTKSGVNAVGYALDSLREAKKRKSPNVSESCLTWEAEMNKEKKKDSKDFVR